MRKYDIKNKRNIGIIIIISIVITIMFSLCISLFVKADKKEFKVSPDTLVFDKDKSIIKVDKESIIKRKWNKEYYLIYQDKNYELGDTAIAYNDKTGEIFLYGKYYEINSSNEINVTEDETVIKSSSLTKFYKLQDRKYLVVDKDIKSADGLLSTNEFLMIDLDKVGNATLTNHKVNLKTFSETTIVTSDYTFDIANEILTYGSDRIDLKKIIGSSNTYTKEDLVPEEDTTGGTGTNGSSSGGGVEVKDNTATSNTTGGTGTGTGNGGNGSSGGGTSTDTDGNKNTGNTTIEEIKKATKETSVISVTSTLSKIRVDYVIYDPKGEYESVYMEVSREGSDAVDTIYLNKNSTVQEITNNIIPNTTYNIKFKYTYLEDNQVKVNTFDTAKITTKRPNVSLKVTRLKGSTVYYLITPDSAYPITSATLVVSVNSTEVKRINNIVINGNTPDSITVDSANPGDIVELRLTNIKANGVAIQGVEAKAMFKY